MVQRVVGSLGIVGIAGVHPQCCVNRTLWCPPVTLELEAGGPEGQGHHCLQSKSEATRGQASETVSK